MVRAMYSVRNAYEQVLYATRERDANDYREVTEDAAVEGRVAETKIVGGSL